MSAHPSNSKHLVIANKTPTTLASLQNLRNPVNYIVSLKPYNESLARHGKYLKRRWSPRNRNDDTIQQVIVESEDIWKGRNMLDPIRVPLNMSLQKIEEEPELLGDDGDNYDLKVTKSFDDLRRLSGGCLSKKESEENIDGMGISAASKEQKLKSSKFKDKIPLVLRSTQCGTCANCFGKKRKLDGNSECSKIEVLEKQIQSLDKHLTEIRQNMSQRDEVEKIAMLSQKINEVNDILKELKLSCWRLEETLMDGKQTSRMDIKQSRVTQGRIISKSLENENTAGIGKNVKEDSVSPENLENPVPIIKDSKIVGNIDMESDWKQFSSHSSRRCNNSPGESLEYLPANHSIPICPIRKLEKTQCYRSFPNSQQSPCLSCQRSYRGEGTTSGPRIPIRYFNNHTESHCSSCEFQASAQKSRNNYRYRRTHAGNESPPLTAKPSEMHHESPFLAHPNSKENISYFTANLPVINSNLLDAILQIIGPTDTGYIALTVILQSNDLYHINISVTNTGQSLGDVYTTEAALQQAEQNRLFERFLTFFVLNSNNTLEQKNRILGHSFEFLNLENAQKYDDQNSDTLGTKTCNTSEDSLKISSDKPLSTEILNSKNQNSPEVRRKASENKENGNFPESKNVVLNKDIHREPPLDETKDNSYNTRLDNLELELKKMRQDLHQLNGKLMPQDKWSKLQQFGERLKDLYSLLEYLRNPSITGAGSRPKEMAKQTDDKSEYNTEQCQRFTAEINRHPTLLEKYLLTLKDFRTDAELRRQRLEKRWQEKLLRKQQQQQQTEEGYGFEIDHKSPRKLSDGNIKQFVGKVVRKLVEVSSSQVVQKKHVNTPTRIKRDINEVENSSTQFNWEKYDNPQNPLNVRITDAKSHPSSKSVKSEAEISLPEVLYVRSSNSDRENISIIYSNLVEEIEELQKHFSLNQTLALTISLEINGLYHISLSDAHTGESLACLYASKEAIREAQKANLFNKYLTFFLLSGDPLLEEANPLIGHLFEIVQ